MRPVPGFSRLLILLMSLSVLPALGQDSLLDRLKRSLQDKPAPEAVRRPQARKLEVPGPLPDLNDQSCSKNTMLRNARTTLSEEVRSTQDTHTFLDIEPVQKISGISSLRLQGTRLSVQLAAQGRFEEFSGPVVLHVERKHYEGSPGVALLAHTLTLGIGLMVAPINSTQHALGCWDSRALRREVLLAESAPTGQSQWRSIDATHVLRIEGLGAPRELNFRTTAVGGQGTFELELLPMVMQAAADQPLSLTISCLSCNAQDSTAAGVVAPGQNQVVLQADFAQARAQELARLERLAQEERARVERLAQEERARLERLAQEERAAAQRRLEAQQALLAFKRSMVGRWSTQDTCLNSKSIGVGQSYELDGEGRLSLRLRMMEGEQLVERFMAQDIDVRSMGDPNWELRLNLRLPGPGARTVSRTLQLRVHDGQMQVIEQRDGNQTVIRGGVVQATGRDMPALLNCEHPRLVAQRAQLEREERERLRRAQLAAEEQRLRLEREEREERERVRRAQAAAEEQRLRLEREEAERQRRQDERNRLYRL